MKPGVLWNLSVRAFEPSAEAVAAVLESELGQPCAIYTHQESRRTTITAYLRRKPAWSRASRLRLLELLKGAGSVEPDSISLKRLKPQNWAESWKRHFKPITIRGKLLIRPEWNRKMPEKGQKTVVLNPGMSFGTGQHPTTHFCLRELVRIRTSGENQSFLDVGTGSGILAISAAKLGYDPIAAIDVDENAIRVARANSRRNNVLRQIRFSCQDLRSLPKRDSYSVVCANLETNLLLRERVRLKALVAKGGRLVVAGILTDEFPCVEAAYEDLGVSLLNRQAKKEWSSGVFKC